MSDPKLFQSDNLDDELIRDMRDSVHDDLAAVELLLSQLECSPDNTERVHELFRIIHTIKGNCRMAGITPLAEYVHAIEDVISELRKGRVALDDMLAEAILLGLDQIKLAVDSPYVSQCFGYDQLPEISATFEKLRDETGAAFTDTVHELIDLLGGGWDTKQLQPAERVPAPIPPGHDPSNDDLPFFMSMAEKLDRLTPYWENRTNSLLDIAHAINSILPEPVDTEQLSTAVLMHDVGIAFLPPRLLEKREKLTSMEIKQIQDHARIGYEWPHRIPGWESATLMVLEHHERPDGNGYPRGLQDSEISAGAKILAVADSFYAITNERADRNYKRSILRAITEINGYRGSQFSDETVEAFNTAVRTLYVNRDSDP